MRTVTRSFVAVIAACVLWTTPLAAKDDPQKILDALPKGTIIERDIVYATNGERKMLLDVYRPKSDKPLPLVIWFYGGAWDWGNKDRSNPMVALIERGYAVSGVTYTKSREEIFPAVINDCRAAVSFLRLNAKQFNLDPKRFGACGESSGGHLTALLATTSDTQEFMKHPVTRKASPAIQAASPWCAPTDFLKLNDAKCDQDYSKIHSAPSRLIGQPIKEAPEKCKRANPITYVSQDDPPCFIVHGDKDFVVPLNQSELLHAALVKAGVPSTLYVAKGGNHGFSKGVESKDQIVEKVADFFDQQLKKDAKNTKAGKKFTTDEASGDTAIVGHLTLDLGKGVSMKLVLIPAGKFMMGNHDSPAETVKKVGGLERNLVDEYPAHEVTISKPFYMGIYEVTQAQWKAVMGTEPWKAERALGYMRLQPRPQGFDDYPVVFVDSYDAIEFCRKLSKKTGMTVSLPTEAQWEYTCRAGSSTAFSFGDDLSKLIDYGWYGGKNAGQKEDYAHRVGQKKPNAWGLYDMHGNVWEFCSDWYDKDFYSRPPSVDPENTTKTDKPSLRSGAFHSVPTVSRSAQRNSWTSPKTVRYNYGLRVIVAADK